MIRQLLRYYFSMMCAMGVCAGLTLCVMPLVGPRLEPLLIKAATNFCAEMPLTTSPEWPAGMSWMGLIMIVFFAVAPVTLRWAKQLEQAEKASARHK